MEGVCGMRREGGRDGKSEVKVRSSRTAFDTSVLELRRRAEDSQCRGEVKSLEKENQRRRQVTFPVLKLRCGSVGRKQDWIRHQ